MVFSETTRQRRQYLTPPSRELSKKNLESLAYAVPVSLWYLSNSCVFLDFNQSNLDRRRRYDFEIFDHDVDEKCRSAYYEKIFQKKKKWVRRKNSSYKKFKSRVHRRVTDTSSKKGYIIYYIQCVGASYHIYNA